MIGDSGTCCAHSASRLDGARTRVALSFSFRARRHSLAPRALSSRERCVSCSTVAVGVRHWQPYPASFFFAFFSALPQPAEAPRWPRRPHHLCAAGHAAWLASNPLCWHSVAFFFPPSPLSIGGSRCGVGLVALARALPLSLWNLNSPLFQVSPRPCVSRATCPSPRPSRRSARSWRAAARTTACSSRSTPRLGALRAGCAAIEPSTFSTSSPARSSSTRSATARSRCC